MGVTKIKNTKKRVGVIVAVLLMAVGFAAISTTLYINGTVNISADQADLDDNVIFTAAKLTYTSALTAGTEQNASLTYGTTFTITNGTNVSIADDGKSISFTTPAELNTIGDYVQLDYTVSNYSQYKVSSSVDCYETTAQTTGTTAGTKATTANSYITTSTVDPTAEMAAYDKTTAATVTGNFKATLSKSYADETAKTYYYQCVLTESSVE